jgi:hypothetical protein
MTFFALAGGALGIPGGWIQRKDEGALITLHPGGNARDAQPRSFGDRSLGHKVKVSLDPFIVEVADLTDLQVDLNDLGSLISKGIIEGNVQDGLGYRKLMHEIFWTNVSFHELLPGGMAKKSLNQGNGFKSNEKKGGRKHLHKRSNGKAGMNWQKVLY